MPPSSVACLPAMCWFREPRGQKRGKQGLIEDGPVTLLNGSVDPRANKLPSTVIGTEKADTTILTTTPDIAITIP